MFLLARLRRLHDALDVLAQVEWLERVSPAVEHCALIVSPGVVSARQERHLEAVRQATAARSAEKREVFAQVAAVGGEAVHRVGVLAADDEVGGHGNLQSALQVRKKLVVGASVRMEEPADAEARLEGSRALVQPLDVRE